MQIFATHSCPIDSANYLYKNPLRARKMITESIQILSCVCQKHEMEIPLKLNGEPFKTPKSRINHPVVLWATEDLSHAKWLLTHVNRLYEIYISLGGEKFVWVPDVISLMESNLSHITVTPSYFCNFAKANSKGLDFRHLPVHKAYLEFLNAQIK